MIFCSSLSSCSSLLHDAAGQLLAVVQRLYHSQHLRSREVFPGDVAHALSMVPFCPTGSYCSLQCCSDLVRQCEDKFQVASSVPSKASCLETSSTTAVGFTFFLYFLLHLDRWRRDLLHTSNMSLSWHQCQPPVLVFASEMGPEEESAQIWAHNLSRVDLNS